MQTNARVLLCLIEVPSAPGARSTGRRHACRGMGSAESYHTAIWSIFDAEYHSGSISCRSRARMTPPCPLLAFFAGATVTECSTAIAESRVRISTGRFLSGVLNVYQQTSPRFTMYPSPVRLPRYRTHRKQLACACSPHRDESRPRECAVAGSPPRAHRE